MRELNPARGITLALHEDAQEDMNRQKPQLINCPKTHVRKTTLHKRLHLFRLMTIKRSRNLRQLRLLNRLIEFRDLEREEAVHMQLPRSFVRRTQGAIPDISTGLALMSNNLSEVYALQMQVSLRQNFANFTSNGGMLQSQR